jgi:hypothetical protein
MTGPWSRVAPLSPIWHRTLCLILQASRGLRSGALDLPRRRRLSAPDRGRGAQPHHRDARAIHGRGEPHPSLLTDCGEAGVGRERSGSSLTLSTGVVSAPRSLIAKRVARQPIAVAVASSRQSPSAQTLCIVRRAYGDGPSSLLASCPGNSRVAPVISLFRSATGALLQVNLCAIEPRRGADVDARRALAH